MYGQMEEDSKEIGLTITCMEEEFTLGRMAEDTKDSMRMIVSMVMEFTLGMMESSMKVNGLSENNTEKEFIEKKEETVRVFGRTVKELSGSMKTDS